MPLEAEPASQNIWQYRDKMHLRSIMNENYAFNLLKEMMYNSDFTKILMK